MTLKNRIRISMLIILVIISVSNIFISFVVTSKVLATSNQLTLQNNNTHETSRLEISNDSSNVVELSEECKEDRIEPKLPPNPRLGWTNPRIPIDPDPDLECVPATNIINSTTNT